MAKPIVLIAEELSPATVEALGSDFDIRYVDGTDRAALLAAIPEAHAVLIRSATQIDAEALAAAKLLKVVARAGVGLDNVDIKAATTAGVMVVNAPTSNIISAAELTIGHILSLARHIPAAHASLSAGEWKRAKYTGVELFEKTVGIIGLGRIGALIAARLQAFGVEIVAYDPYVTPARAQQLGVHLVTLDELLERSDFISIHMPKTPETTGMISTEQLAQMKPTAFIVNVARGGLIDEDALYEALKAGVIAGAGLDVFVSEPPTESKLLSLPNVVVTPHLGASTDEAQEKAGVSVARSVRLALEGELVPDAVNVAGGTIDPFVRPGITLVEKLGQVLAAIAGHGALTDLEVDVRGELAAYDVSVYRLAALKGVLHEPRHRERLVRQRPACSPSSAASARSSTSRRRARTTATRPPCAACSPTARRSRSRARSRARRWSRRSSRLNGYDIEVPVADHHIVMFYTDRPGIVAIYGKEFGEAGINIAGMQIARRAAGGQALSIITVDSPVPEELLEKIRSEIDADLVREIDIIEP